MKTLLRVRQGPSPRGPRLLSLVLSLHFPYAQLLEVPQISHYFTSPFHTVLSFLFPVHLGNSCTLLNTLHSHHPIYRISLTCTLFLNKVGGVQPAQAADRCLWTALSICSLKPPVAPVGKVLILPGWLVTCSHQMNWQPSGSSSCWFETFLRVCEYFWWPSLW